MSSIEGPRRAPAPRLRWCGVILFSALIGLLAVSPAVADTESTSAEQPALIRFHFQDASFKQVIDFFSRQTGLPVIWETPAPDGTLDYISPDSYEVDEALRVLNIILQSKGVMLRESNEMLYLQQLTEMQREDIPTFIGELPMEVTDDQIVTVVRPLNIAVASTLAERLKEMIASYGSISALNQQNALVITETAAQIRRLNEILDELDRQDPGGVIEIIKIKHAKAADIMEPLKALLTQRVEKFVINQKGQQVRIEEDSMPGLNIGVDARTNSLIAKGVRSRVDQLLEAIRMLDVPDAGAIARSMRTFTLAVLTPGEAVKTLDRLFAAVPQPEKPTLMPFNESGRLAIIGSAAAISEAEQVLAEVDGGVSVDGDNGERVEVMTLEHAQPDAVVAALNGLLAERHRRALRIVATPGGNGIIVAGPASIVSVAVAVVPALDTAEAVRREVRVIELTTAEPGPVVDRATALYRTEVDASGHADDAAHAVVVELDEGARLLTLVGTKEALTAYDRALRLAQEHTAVDRETRQITLANARPTAVVGTLTRLAQQMLAPRDGTEFTAPTFDAIDDLDLLIVTATSEQYAVIESLVATLDRKDPADREFRTITLRGVDDVDLLINRTLLAFDRMTSGYEADEMPRPDVEHDPLSGMLMVTGPGASVRLFDRALAEARNLMPPARDGRMIALTQASVADVIEPLNELIAQTMIDDGSRRVLPPQVQAIDRTNSLFVIAEPTQHQVIERLVRELDTIEPTDLPPLRLLQVRAADASRLSAMLRQRYDARPPEQRREAPVTIDADAATNTLIVTAHTSVFDEIREFVDSVNRAEGNEPERETSIFPLKRARAQDLATALEKLYPQPPMPLDRRGNPMPHLREPREVYVSADAATNTLIIEAPAERKASFEALVTQLDRVELPPRAQLRTYRIERGDPDLIARTLSELARRGVMTDQPADGSKPVDVLIQAEPKSRTLIVAGDDVTFAQTESILGDLEVVPVQRSLRVFEIRGGDPVEIAKRAERLYADQTAQIPSAQPVDVEIDPSSGSLLVVAEDEAMMRFAGILNQLLQTVGPPPNVDLIPLEYAEAADVVAFLRDMVGSAESLMGSLGGPAPTFEAIERTNSVMVAAIDDHSSIIRAMISGLDQEEPQQTPPLRIMQLRSADAANLAQALNAQYARRPVDERNLKPVMITADAQTNALMVAAHADLLPEIASIVEELNRTDRMDVEGREIRIFPLKVARAEELARTIDEMFPEPPVPVDRRGNPMQHLRQPREVVVRADPQTNSIIVDAPVQRLAGFEQLVEQLDRQRISDETEVRTYPVTHAEIATLVSTLNELAQSGSLSPAGQDRRVPIIVTSEPVSRTLVVSGPAEIFSRVEQVISDLDVRASGPATSLRFFQLEHARAESTADMLRQILSARMRDDVPDAGSDVESLLDVTADRKTNTVIVSAPASLQAVAEALIEQLDRPSAAVGDATVRVRPLIFADAGAVASSLGTALPQMTSRATGESIDVRLIPAPGSNAIIMVGLAMDLDDIETLVEPLDARPAMDAVDARTFNLEFASAADVAGIVETLLADQLANDPRIIMEQMRRNRGQVTVKPTIRVEADERTNSLIVSGPQRTVALADGLITQLDRPTDDSPRTYDVFTPANVAPVTLAASVTRLIEMTDATGRPSRVTLDAEETSGAIVVAGPTDEVERALRLLAERDDAAPVAPPLELRVIALEYADAAAAANVVGPMLANRAAWPAELQAAARTGLAFPEPTVTADAAGNRLLVSAPRELANVAEQIVNQLDRDVDGAGSLETRVFTLKQADAAGVAEALGSAMTAERNAGRPATVVAEPSSNAVVVTAVPDALATVASLVAQLDEGRPADGVQVRTVFLENARAETVAPIVKELLVGDDEPDEDWFNWSRRRAPIEKEPEIRVSANARLNAVVVAAPPATLVVAEEMVRQLDVTPMTDAIARRSVRVLEVRNADVTDLAASLSDVFAETEDGDAAPTIRVDVASNSLLVRATNDQFERIETVVEQLDDATLASGRQMRMIPVDPGRASVDDVAEALRRLLEQSGGGDGVEVITLEELLERRKPAPEPTSGMLPVAAPWMTVVPAALAAPGPDEWADVTIAVDPATNSLVVVGAPRQIERIEALITEVQAQLPSTPGRLRYIALPEEVDPNPLSQLVNQTLRRMTPPGGAAGGYRDRVFVAADPDGGGLLVVASDHDFATVADLIGALAKPPAADAVVVKIYPLSTTTAERAAATVSELIAPGSTNRRRGRQAERLRNLAIEVMAGDEKFEAVFNPDRVSATADTVANALIVRAPADAVRFIDELVELIDQRPVNVQSTLKLYPLLHARASNLTGILQGVFRARARALRDQPGPQIQPEFAADDRTNTLLVTAAPEQLAEVDTLLVDLDRETGEDQHPLRIVALESAQPSTIAQLLDDAVVGTDQARRSTTLIVPNDDSGVLIVRASDEVNAEIDRLLLDVDRNAADDLPVRTLVVERADAMSVADAIQRFFDDRARITSSGRGRRDAARTVSVIGDAASKTLLIAADDDDFKEIEGLVAQFDSPQATGAWDFRVFTLRHAKATEIETSLEEIVESLTWGQSSVWWGGGNPTMGRGTLAIKADSRLNAVIVTGEGEKFDLVGQVIDVLDAPPNDSAQRIVRIYPVTRLDPRVVGEVIESMFSQGDSGGWSWRWRESDPSALQVRVDRQARTLIVAGSAAEQAEVAELIESFEMAPEGMQQEIAVLPVEYVDPRELARSLEDFIEDRADATGSAPPRATIMSSDSARSLVVSAADDVLAMIKDLVVRLDQPDVSGDRVIEIVALRDSEAAEIARIVEEQFPARSGTGVIVTADSRTNSLIINGPREQFAQAKALIGRLDARDAADETIIRTYALDGARASEVVRILTDALQLDADGEAKGTLVRLDAESEAIEVTARVTADSRSNSLVVAAPAESLRVIESIINDLDEVPAVSPVEYHIVELEHAMAVDIVLTLDLVGNWGSDDPEPNFDYNRLENQVIVSATADQFAQISKVIEQLDQPSDSQRITEFIPLEYAEAEKVQEALAFFYGPYAAAADTPDMRNVRIVADPATNSLVVSASEGEWQNIRSLLSELDSEEYDASLQLRVIPLTYADARSVAQAINEAFETRVEQPNDRGNRGPVRPQGNEDDQRRPIDAPSVLVQADEWVRVSAERQTNSLIVSANLANIRKIELIVESLDVADYAKLPPPRIIPVAAGNAQQLAQSLEALYQADGRGAGRRGLRIIGDEASNTIVVRAEDEDFQQIVALADALQQEASGAGLSVEVVKLDAAPARRVADALREAFSVKADQTGLPLSIETDPVGNSLIIAATGGMLDEIKATVAELDALAPSAGQAVFIIELEHIAPDAATRVIETIGLDQPVGDDTASRLVSEPIRVSTLDGRNAIVVVANPADRDTIVEIVKAVDSEPAMAESMVRLVQLRSARASRVAEILGEVLAPAEQQAQTPLAEAVREQVRRLAVRRTGLDEPDLDVDLTQPIRIVADDESNTLLVGSIEANVNAIVDLIGLLDRLPVTDAVTVQLFPLSNIGAGEFVRIVGDLFDQGKQLANVPGVDIAGIPDGMLGRALIDDVAITTDERTNTVVVAGREEAVALVEVLTTRLDSEVAIGWLEPRVLPLEHADATDLAETLDAILVEGIDNLPQSTPMQRQIGRLRMARMEGNGGRVLEADVFQPMTRLVIRPEPQLNALVLVGTPINLEVVTELVGLLDIPAASPDSTVRIYPIKHASASRLESIIERLFDQQVTSKAIRPEDRVIVQSDERSNALIASTSPRSFAVLESLLQTLDAEIAPDLREIRRIALEHASASRLAQMIQQLMDARLERLQRVQPETADLERATVVADARTNSLVIAAGNESYEVIRMLAEDLDRSTLQDLSLVEVISLDSANADRVAETIDAVMERRYAEMPADVRKAHVPLVMTDTRSNSLLVAANTEDVTAIRDLVVKLEAAPINPAVGVHVLALPPTASAETLAPRLQSLMRDRQQSLGDAQQPSDRVTIEADEFGNTLIVAASPEHLEVIEGLVETLVAAGEDAMSGRTFEIVAVETGRATEIAEMLDELYVDEAQRVRGDGAVQVTADERSNSIVVSGGPEDIQAVRDLVAQLDGAKPATVVEIRYVELTSANAVETVSLINNVLSGRGIGARRGSQQATVLKYLKEIDGESSLPEMEVSAAIRESIVLTPDVRTNTIIVSAPRQSMQMIENMILDLDSSSTGAKSIRIFKLTNADALAMADVLAELFNLRQGSNLFVLKPREDAAMEPGNLDPSGIGTPGAGAGIGIGGTELTAVPDERQQLSITVDSRTNSLLVSGTPTYLDLVDQVVTELDALEANEREVFVYPLRNAEATQVAGVISEFVRLEQEKLVGTLSDDQLGSAARVLEREVTIQGDEQSNSVLVSASPRYIENVREMIAQLDVDPPQVLIQVMLAEITLDSLDDWGVDMAVRGETGSASLSAGFGLASAFVGGMGVPTLTVAATDFDLMVRALRTQGRLQVLSNPSVVAANNFPAELQVGETIRVADTTSFTEGGTSNTSTSEQELGIRLNVTPSINPDGYVRMNVEPSISALSARTVQINEDLETPVITVRRASTTVTVRDGQTIVIGGLISDRFERRERKVPFLGDLPIVGPLFSSETEQATKTELLIVLTPHVIQSPTDTQRVDTITGEAVDRLSLPEIIRDRVKQGTLDIGDGLYDADGKRIDLEEMDDDE